MQEDGPLLPGKVECPLQLFHIRHDAEAALGIGMVKGIGRHHHGLRHAGLAPGCQFQQGFGGLGGQVVGQGQQGVLGRRLDIFEPLGGNAVAE